MALNKPNQRLRRELKDAATLLKWPGVDLFQSAQRLSDSGHEAEALELIKISVSFEEAEDRLRAYADEVKAMRIPARTCEAPLRRSGRTQGISSRAWGRIDALPWPQADLPAPVIPASTPTPRRDRSAYD